MTINKIICCAAFVPVMAFGADDGPDAKVAAMRMNGNLWRETLPPTSSDGADALDRQVYSQFASDEGRLASEPGSAISHALLPHGAVAGYYDDNLSLTRTNRQGGMVFAFEPGLALGLGDFKAAETDFLTADYTGRWTTYPNHSSADGYEQFATARAGATLAKWRFDANFHFMDLNDVDIDSGARAGRRIYDSTLGAAYDLSEKDFLEAQARSVERDYQTGPDSAEWLGRFFYNYRLDPGLTVGGGAAAGVLNVRDFSGQTYEQALARFAWNPSPKISLSGQAGLETRQLGSGEDRLTPVLELAAEYLPGPSTAVDFSAYRRNLGSSAYGDLDYTASGLEISAGQSLGPRWKAILSCGWENNSYFLTDVRASSPREDNFLFVNPAVRLQVGEHARIELFYNFRRNDSSDQPRGFADSQAGMRAGFSF